MRIAGIIKIAIATYMISLMIERLSKIF